MLFNPRFLWPAIVLGLLLTFPAFASEVPQGKRLSVQVERDVPMKVGETVRARTVYPTYVHNRLALPAGVELLGTIKALDPVAKKKSRDAKLGGDFTPLHTPKIEFHRLVFSDGTEATIHALPASGGVEVVRFQARNTGAKRSSLLHRLWAEAVGREKDTVRTFTAPGKGERLRRALYAELPYHPQLLTEGTEFSVELSAPLTIAHLGSTPPAPGKTVGSPVTLAAELMDDINSRHAVRGTKVRAVVTQPLFNQNGKLQVPQGSVLLGEITQAKPAGKWGKGGVLRFSFRELQFPQGFVQKVHGAPVAVDMDRRANLQLDAEGGVKPAPKGVGAPLVMGLLTATALHEDEASGLDTAGTSNGFALIGRVIALAAKSQYVGAAFGLYGTGRAVYSRWIAHGEDVSFRRHTRIEVTFDPERVKALRPMAR